MRDLSGLAVVGIVAGLLMPIAGAVIAIVLYARGDTNGGAAVLIACAVGFMAYLSLAG